jgi:hypothetical protein
MLIRANPLRTHIREGEPMTYDEGRDFGAAVTMKRDLLNAVETLTLIDAPAGDLVLVAKELAGLGWRKPDADSTQK